MTRRALLVPVAAFAAAAIAGCGSSSGDDGVGTAAGPSAGTRPTTVPAAAGEVTTSLPVTVIEQSDQPVQLCLGNVTAIFPPDCGGPEVTGWDWSAWDRGDDYRSVGGTTFGQFIVTGSWDGTTLDLTEAVPGDDEPLLDGAGPQPTVTPPALDRAELQRAAREVGRDLPGAAGAYVARGRVLVDVTYDDGSLQDWCDREYGAGVVVVSPELEDVGS